MIELIYPSCDLLINNNFLEDKTIKKIFAINKPELALGHSYNMLGPKLKIQKTINKINKILFFLEVQIYKRDTKVIKNSKIFKNLNLI